MKKAERPAATTGAATMYNFTHDELVEILKAHVISKGERIGSPRRIFVTGLERDFGSGEQKKVTLFVEHN